jgi:hypothetical protein
MQEGSNNALRSGDQIHTSYEEISDLFPIRRKRLQYSESIEKNIRKNIMMSTRILEQESTPGEFNSTEDRESFLGKNSIDKFFKNFKAICPSKLKKVFKRDQIFSSKMICQKCKNKLLSSGSKRILVSSKMYKSTKIVSPINLTFDDSTIYKNQNEVQKLVLKPKSLIAMRMLDIDLTKELNDPKLEHFNNLRILILKFLMNQKIEIKELTKLKKVEQQLFLLLVNKKRVNKKSRISEEFINELNEQWIPKRFEENLRYILNKAFKFLNSTFEKRQFYHLEKQLNPKYKSLPWKSRFYYGFYGYYFHSSAQRQNKPIESYFHPKASKYSQNSDKEVHPKTISQYYLNSICTSKLFRRDLMIYIDECLTREAKHNIIFKVDKLCKSWEKDYLKNGHEMLVKDIHKQFTTNPKCKIPWGLQEVDTAVRNIKQIIQSKLI